MQNRNQRLSRKGFTLMEMLVVVAIITVLAAIAFPVIASMRSKANKITALSKLKNLAAANSTYAAAHNGVIPDEDAGGKESWSISVTPTAEKVWYNALPRQMGERCMADFVNDGKEADFYTKQNFLYLPGAAYPMKQKLTKPLFAIAINTKLHRRARLPDGKKDPAGLKADLNISTVQMPSRTVLFLERGLPGEKRAQETISKSDYDGSGKSSAKAFVARYADKGVLAFFDGHTEEVSGKDILAPDGRIIWDSTMGTNNQSAIFWTPDPREDPN